MRVTKVTEENATRLLPGIVALEQNTTYPFGEDSFAINHGKDYFKFFERLGDLIYYVMEHDDQVVAVAGAILRDVPFVGTKNKRGWYICDLKVRPDFRGQHLPLKFLGKTWLQNYLRCPRGYAISMNSSAKQANRIAKLMARFRWLRFRLAAQLQIYALDYDQVIEQRALLERHLGPVSFLSLRGQKDLVLQSTGKPLPLLHLQHGPCGVQGAKNPQSGFTHMFCLTESDSLIGKLAEQNIHPHADASLIAHGMSGCNWKFVLTSDI